MRLARTTLIAAAAIAAAACTGGPTSVPPGASRAAPLTAPPTGAAYVAMGDSAAAAPLVPDQGQPTGCFKSTNNYPSVVARRIGAVSFTDVTCSGARTDDLVSRSQATRSGPVPPQLDAVSADTRLVTITIGGNDVELSSSAAQCRRASLAEAPCSTDLVVDGVDTVARAIESSAADWAELVDAVRAKAPDARIVLVGYGTFIRPQGCFPAQPINPVDAAYFQARIDELDARQRELAAEKGIEFFDAGPLSAGHDMCSPPDERYVEGFLPVNPAAPLHPNGRGAEALGTTLADYLTSVRRGTG